MMNFSIIFFSRPKSEWNGWSISYLRQQKLNSDGWWHWMNVIVFCWANLSSNDEIQDTINSFLLFDFSQRKIPDLFRFYSVQTNPNTNSEEKCMYINII